MKREIEEIRRAYESEEMVPIIQQYAIGIMAKALEGVYKLDDKDAEKVLKEMGAACSKQLLVLAGVDKEKDDLDTVLAKVKATGFGPDTIERQGDTILLTFHANGKCVCPMVRLGLVKLNPKQCICSVNMIKRNVEVGAKKPVECELIESVAYGDENCVIRVNLTPNRK